MDYPEVMRVWQISEWFLGNTAGNKREATEKARALSLDSLDNLM